MHILETTVLCQIQTQALRDILDDIPLNSYEIISWIRHYMHEQYDEHSKKNN